MSSATKVLLLLLLPFLEIFSTISSLLSSSWCHMAMIIWWKSLLNAVIISFWHLHIRLDKTVIFTCKIVTQCHKHVFVFLYCTCQFFKTGFTYTYLLSTHHFYPIRNTQSSAFFISNIGTQFKHFFIHINFQKHYIFCNFCEIINLLS